ncbi:hypothetical protein SPRG_03551 [Saprolegnia parasitica CBS 223.65]|uniref:RING-type domain-containing protein n=1 Tax=Saprolegnia parasitica (strain CBS 223.65) TaxID=695850 RepID=A0A067CYP1_SAPPC|nr:hypothetical protein SPRG_03551 [Saprolegnia parasitica CBS 223.65]KDO31631.1 hypothetical protein SPRG_03551 [Saprolegnia parasitica CBS 223.65]|eukprot:XP_012197521.1 hypothetical protein SPRG_03551 [Saprolegnia parasitica CBS 223.65]
MVFVSLDGCADAPSAVADSVPNEHPVAVRVTPGSPPKPVKSISPVKTLDDEFVVFVSDRATTDRWALRKTYRQVADLHSSIKGCVVGANCRRFACCGPLRRVAKARMPRQARKVCFRFEATLMTLDAKAAQRTMGVEEYLNETIMATNGRDAECPSLDAARTALDAFLEVAHRREAKASATIEALLHGLRVTDAVSVHIECSVCLTSFRDDANAVQLPCSHVFHAPCVEQWLAKSTTCPVCRQPVTAS